MLSPRPLLASSAARSVLRGVFACVVLAAAGAHAATIGTAANTSISNTATFAYSYTGTGGATATSTTANTTFVVDRKVDLTLIDHNGGYNSAQSATPGPGTNPALLRYTLTNTSNATLDFNVVAIDSTDPYGGTDSYDQTATVFVDVNGDGTYTAATDTATFVDELASGSSIAVFVVGTIPTGAINLDISGKLLTATARAGGTVGGSVGAVLTQTGGNEAAAVMETLFTDAAGATDAARDAAISTRDAFKVISTVLGISKSVTVLNDPINLTINPKAIPGATLRYTMVVNNPPAPAAAVQTVTITDALPAGVTYVGASITVNGGAAGTDANDGVDASGFDVRQSGGTVTVLLGNMAANTTHTIRFSVTVNAGQTPATSIPNTGSAAYLIAGVAQTPKTSTATFLVDRNVNLTLTDHNTALNSAQTPTLVPGTTNAVLRYTLTNTGNGVQDFAFATADTSNPYAGADTYDQTASVFVDVNADGTYTAATDTATFADELAVNASIAVFVVGPTVALSQVDNDISAKLLTATVRAGGGAAALGAALTAPNVADTATLVDNVFSDAAGTVDVARDGALDAKDAFKVTSAVLTVAKSSTVLSDPTSGGTNPKAIPGATVRYTIVVANASGAGAAAQTVTVSDALPAGVTFVSPSITVDGGATGTDANDGVDASGFDVRQSGGTVTVLLGNMAANTTRTIRFSVTVNAGQAVGNSIANTASAAYDVSSVTQTAKTGVGTFLVDRDVKFTLIDHNGAFNSAQTPSPAPGSSNAVLRYTLANTGNGTQDFSFAALVDSTNPYAGSDNYDQGATLFVDVNANGNYDAGTDTAAFVDELAAGTSIAVFVVGPSVSLARIDGDISAKLVTATALTGGVVGIGGAITATPLINADTVAAVDIVFSDAAGFADAARDAMLGVRDAFKVVAARMSVTKMSQVVSDPVNGTGVGRKRIPGSTIRYTMVVTNDALAATTAASVVLKDLIPSNTTFVSGTLTLDAVADPDADAVGNDCDFGITTPGKVSCALGTMAVGQSHTITFDVTVD